MMTQVHVAKLERIKHYATRYELALIHPDGRSYLIAYVTGRSRASLLRVIREEKRAPKLVEITGSESIDFAKRAADGGTMGEWRIRFTGRTQRECILGGELPFILDVES